MNRRAPPETRDPTLADVTQALRQFLEEPDPSVFAMTGKWGRGKSFFWREFVRNHVRDTDERHYSYISLFGLGELQHLKDAIFDNAIPLRDVGREGGATKSAPLLSRRNLLERAKGLTWRLKKFGAIAEKAPTLSDLGPFARALAFLSVRNYVVCIDDLERRGTNLALRDVLGMATLLREQKNCRVIVILNSDALEDDRADYERLREKVFDYDMVFEPKAIACAEIVFPDEDEYHRLARIHVATLNITNIRVLFRVRRLLDALLREAREASDDLKRQLIHSAVLLGWCYNTKDGTAPSYDYVKGRNYGRIARRVLGNDPSEEERHWDSLLEAYDYRNTDELDSTVCDTLERGFADTRALKDVLANREQAAQRRRLEQDFHEAWQIFHGGYGSDEERLAEAFRTSIEAAPELIGITNADTTIRLLRAIGHEALANEIVALWCEAKQRLDPTVLNLADNPLGMEVRDQPFREAIDAAHAAVAPALPSLREVVERLASQNAWGDTDIRVLSASSEDDVYALFKSLSGPKTRPMVRACLQFVGLSGDPNYAEIGTRVRAALLRIAAESPLNAERLQTLGVSIEKEPRSPAAPAREGD